MSTDVKTRDVEPVGVLSIASADRRFFLLHPAPIQGDWEPQGFFRFVVVPAKTIKEGVEIFPYARHVVINADFVIEYLPTIGVIKIVDLDDYDLQYEERSYTHGQR